MYPSEVSKFFNVGTFSQNALNSNFLFPNMSSTVIPTRSRQIPAKSEKMAGIPRIRRNPVNPLLRRHVPSQICSFPTSLGPKKIRNREKKKKKKPKPARFCRIPARFSPESLFMVAGITVEGILGKKI